MNIIRQLKPEPIFELVTLGFPVFLIISAYIQTVLGSGAKIALTLLNILKLLVLIGYLLVTWFLMKAIGKSEYTYSINTRTKMIIISINILFTLLTIRAVFQQ